MHLLTKQQADYSIYELKTPNAIVSTYLTKLEQRPFYSTELCQLFNGVHTAACTSLIHILLYLRRCDAKIMLCICTYEQ